MKNIKIDTTCISQTQYIPFTVELDGKIYEGTIVRSSICVGGLPTEDAPEIEWVDDEPTEEQVTDDEIIEAYENALSN